MKTTEVELAKLEPPVTRPFADPAKVARLGPFDWAKYRPIEVENHGGNLVVDTINALYLTLLHLGFIVLRQAIDAKDWEWADRERQFLHNIPSLINEPNIKRHECFWVHERAMYLEWIDRRGGEPKSRMLTYYDPTLREMEPVMQELLASTACHTGGYAASGR